MQSFRERAQIHTIHLQYYQGQFSAERKQIGAGIRDLDEQRGYDLTKTAQKSENKERKRKRERTGVMQLHYSQITGSFEDNNASDRTLLSRRSRLVRHGTALISIALEAIVLHLDRKIISRRLYFFYIRIAREF